MGLAIFGFIVFGICLILLVLAASRKRVKKWWIMGMAAGFIIFFAGAVSSGDADGKPVLNKPFDANKIKAGMMWPDDFEITDRFNRFMKVVFCDEVRIEDDALYFTESSFETSVDAGYFLWVCYPDWQSGDTYIIGFRENSVIGGGSVIGVAKGDTKELYKRFGDTIGTKDYNWK